ncbi:hypothetical protein WA171_006531, partial [Blastocystis sp. BT1]
MFTVCYGIEYVLLRLLGDERIQELRRSSTYLRLLNVFDGAIVLNTYFIVSFLVLMIRKNLSGVISNFAAIVVDRILFLVVLKIFIPSQLLNSESYWDCFKRFMDFFRRHLSFLLLFFLFPTIQNGYSDHPIERSVLISTCFLSPLIEELLFRGYLCNLFISRVGTFEGIVGSSVCFSLIHIITMFSGESLLVVGTRMLLSWLGGVIFGYSMVDGTILASQFMHISNNLISQLLFSIHHVE